MVQLFGGPNELDTISGQIGSAEGIILVGWGGNEEEINSYLKKYGVIRTIPPSVGSRKSYFAIEDKMRAFSKHIGIPLEDLDLLFWSLQTGHIFK